MGRALGFRTPYDQPMLPPNPAASLLGRLGSWSNVNPLPTRDALRWGRRVEELGYDTLWVNETAGWEPIAMLGALAAATERVTLSVGIAMTYARDAMAAHAAARTVADLSDGRFVMGLGVSHASSVELRGDAAYGSPLATMRAYLEAYRKAPFQGNATAPEPPLVLAALGPRMLELATTESDGPFVYFVPVEEVARVRAAIDATAVAAGRPHRPVLVVTVPVRLETDPGPAREAARRYMDRHLGQPNYVRNLLRCGFTEDEIARPGADRLVDALVAWGPPAALRRRVEEMHAAGADHVAVIPLRADGTQADPAGVEALAPG
jgi:probable F420-dependent oxidoreductase